MSRLVRALPIAALAFAASAAHAAGPDLGQAQKQPLNLVAISMFVAFVALTVFITYWAARRTKSTSDFYSAGGGITGWQNGIAIAGDYMSAASFLGIASLVYTTGYDGLIYSIGFLVGWPIVMFLMAERLRNLGKYTFSDVVSYRLEQTPMRILSASGTLVVVAFYLIAQMVGAGQLIKLLFGLDYLYAIILVGVLMVCYVTFGGMLATTWVQIIKAVMLLSGATFMAGAVLAQFGWNPVALFAKAVEVHPSHGAIMTPIAAVASPLNNISLGIGLMFGTAGLPHILMRFFTVKDASAARKSVFYATGLIGYFYILTFIIGFGAIVMVGTNPDYAAAWKAPFTAAAGLKGGGNMAAIHLADAVGGSVLLGFISAVAFATILAVVSGLTLSGASAISHDLYASVIRRGRVSDGSRGAGVQDRHDLPRRSGDRPGNRVREGERGFHGGLGFRHCRFCQFPSAFVVDVLEGLDHQRCIRRRLAWFDHRHGAYGAQLIHLEGRVGLPGRNIPLHRARDLLHAAGVHRVLVGVGHGPKRAGRYRSWPV